MAQFYGTVHGKAQQASRLGSKKSGLKVSALSYEGRVDVSMWHDEKAGCDQVTISAADHNGNNRRVLFEGPVELLPRGAN